jgi:hypothetical protein
MKKYIISFSHEIKPDWRPWTQSKVQRLGVAGYIANTPPTILTAKDYIQSMGVKLDKLVIHGISETGDKVKTKDPREPDTKPDNIINNKNVNIMNTDNEYGYLELVDTVADAVELGKKLFEALKDGVQLNDAFVLLAEAKNIEEIVQDAPQAFLELKDLDPEEAQAAAALLAERIDAEPGSALDIVEQALNLLTRGYVYFSDVIRFGRQWKKAA